MRLETCFTAAEVDPAAIQGRVAVVIDLIRATTVMVEALANGVRAIYPTLSSDDAVKLAATLGREDTLLCGERKGLRMDGFDLGNSPGEFVSEVVRGKRLVMSTTNGTRAFLAAQGGSRVLAASLLNLSAVAEELARIGSDVVVVCAGKEDRFALDDAVCAGLLLKGIRDRREGGLRLDDASLAAVALAERMPADADFLARTAAGAALVEIGLGEDLTFCALQDRHLLIPEMHDRVIRPGLPRSEG